MQKVFFPSRQIGEYKVTALSDGAMAASLGLLSGITDEEAGAIQCQAGIAEPGEIHINCYLVQGKGKNILIDAGTGGLNDAGGELKKALDALGIHPDQIDVILLTHGHPDHIGGLSDAEGRAIYQQAELWIHPLEAEHWLSDNQLNQANERGQRNFALARRVLQAYKANLHFLNEHDVVTGVSPMWLPGHTPGHSGFRIVSGSESLLIWGDIVHYPHVQTSRPEAAIAFDCDPIRAEETRKAVLALAAQEKLLVAGMHLGRAGFAYVQTEGEGYKIVYL